MSHDSSPSHPLDRSGDPLTFALSGLMAEAPGTVREYPLGPADVEVGEGVILTRPVTGRVKLSRTNRGLVVEAKLETAMAGECARCLLPVETVVKARIDEEVLPTIDLASGQPVPLEEDGDPEAPRLTDHHELELRPLVAEAVSLQEPIAYLCEPDCPGLCPECGERMVAGHGHGDVPIDPRLEALRAFRFDGDDENR
jgi:DUF177 domain-containing protein